MNLPNEQMALRNAGSGSGQRALMSPSRARRSSSQGLNHQTLEPAKSQGLNPQTLQPVVTIEMARRTLERAGAPAEWGVTAELFQTALERSATHRFQAGSGESRGRTPATREVEQYLSSLNAAELALACACAAGIGAAWDHFMAKFRRGLYRAAGASAARGGGRDWVARARLRRGRAAGMRQRGPWRIRSTPSFMGCGTRKGRGNRCSTTTTGAASFRHGSMPFWRSVMWTKSGAVARPNRSTGRRRKANWWTRPRDPSRPPH